MFLKIYSMTPEQYRTLLDFLASPMNIVQQGFEIKHPTKDTKIEVRAEGLAYVSRLDLHTDRDKGQSGNLDITIGIPVLYRDPNREWQRVSRKIIDRILDLMDVFGD